MYNNSKEESKNNAEKKITRSDVKFEAKTRTGVFASSCLFCGTSRKRVKGTEQRLINVVTTNFESNIRKYIEMMEDDKLAAKLSGADFTAKEIKYHGVCRVKYQTEAEARMKEKKKKDEDATSISYGPVKLIYI